MKVEGQVDDLPTKASLSRNSIKNEVDDFRVLQCTGHLSRDPPSTLPL